MSFFIKMFVTFVSACSILHAAVETTQQPGMTVPLHYYPQYGIYTATLNVGLPIQTLEAIIDTGSSDLVLVADKIYCPSCASALTKGNINPKKTHLSSMHDKLVTLQYGSAFDIASAYTAPIQFSNDKKKSFSMDIFLLKNSSQPTSIIGFIHHDLGQSKINFTPFLVKMTDNFTKYSELTFVMCGDKGKSYFHLGPMALPKPLVRCELLPSHFYEVFTFGFYDTHNQPIVKTQSDGGHALLDTGTGGFIILTDHLYQPLYDYIYKNAGTNNQAINQKFWQKNYCVLKKELDFAAFPTIKIGLQTLGDHRPYYLELPPKAYISQAGCGLGYARLVFNKGLPPNHPTAIRNDKARAAANVMPDMIIGTSIFNHYAVSIHYQEKPYLSFYNNDSFCNKK